ncbi:MAG: hypothetical protein Q8P76_00325 [bacterium]|nr:hypothetical protein [bacterium]
MIKVTEIREKSEAGSTEFLAKEISPADAVKILVDQELGRGAIVAEVVENKLITMAQNADGSWDEVIFEGTGKEFKLLLEQAAYFSTAWSTNLELLENVCAGELSTKSSKTMPLACRFAAPVSLAYPNNLKLLLGKGLKPEKSTSSVSRKSAKIYKDRTAIFHAVYLIATPLADC